MTNDPSESDEHGERRMTTDPDRIREWAEDRDAVPVSTHGGEGHGHAFARRDDLGEDHEERTWDEFAETFENQELVFVYEEAKAAGDAGGLGHYELIEREAAFDRTDLGRDELEDALRQGETVTTEIVETQVVETEIIERDTIESEVVETELAERTVVDSELINRAIVDTEFVAEDEIEVLTEETRLDTVEEIERYTVESRVVDVDVEQHDELERDEIETDVELETIQRSILESDVVRSDVQAEDVLADEVVRSKRTEGDVVQTELLERRTIEEQIEERTRRRFTLESQQVVETEVVGSDLLEGEIIDVEEYGAIETTAEPGAEAERGDRSGPMTGTERSTESETGADERAIAATDDPETERGDRSGPMTGTERSMERETDAEEATGEAGAVALGEGDEGKTVVDESGQQVGIVADVEGQTAYVDPQPGIADRLKARLGWGDHGDEEYPIERAQIADVTDDEVVVRGGEGREQQ